MIDCLTYRQAEALGLSASQGAGYYAKLAEVSLTKIKEAKSEAELEQDELVLNYFAEVAVGDFPVWPQNK